MIFRFTMLAGVIFVSALSAGCDVFTGPAPRGPLEYVVEELEVVERTPEWASFPVAFLRAEVALVNQRADSIVFGHGTCGLELEASAGPDGGDEPAWRSGRRRSWPGSIGFVCSAVGLEARLGPGDTLRSSAFRAEIPLAEILADSLPVGRYSFRGTVRTGVEEARVELGRVLLPESRFPLPGMTFFRDGFRYRVDVESDPASPTAVATLRVSFGASVRQRPLQRTLSRECPLRLLAFAKPRSRETIPLPEPAWAWPPSCGAGDVAVRLGPGQERTFETEIPTAELVAARAAPGPQHLLAVVDVEGRPIRIAGGELELQP